jgi:hypothetical protein
MTSNSSPGTNDRPSSHSDTYSVMYGRSARIGLLSLFFLTVLFAAGALVVKYKLETFRGQVQEEARRRTGSDLQVGSVIVNGLRGLRVDELDIVFAPRNAPRCRVTVPSAYIHVNLVDLIYGDITIDRIQMDGANIVLEHNGNERVQRSNALERWSNDLMTIPAFRIRGRDCRFEFKSAPDADALALSDFSFDIARLTDSPDLSARLEGMLEKEQGSAFAVTLRYASLEDFDARIEIAGLTAGDLARAIDHSAHGIEAGTVSPRLRIAGYPNDTWIVSCTAPFEGVKLQNQPDFLDPLDGVLTGLATYHLPSKQLNLNSAQLEAGQLQGTISGDIRFGQDSPALDLKLDVQRWPVAEVLNLLVHQRFKELGALDVTMDESHDLRLTVQGTLANPTIAGQADVSHGAISFKPADATTYPAAQLTFRRLQLAWDSNTNAVTGAMMVEDGSLSYAPWELSADNIAGAVSFDQPQIRVEPFTAQVRGSAVAGRLRYDYEAQEGDFAASGTLTALETTPLHTRIHDTTVAGSLHLQLTGQRNQGQYEFDALVDATQTSIAYEWWFDKPPGIGAAARVIANIVPQKKIRLNVDGEIASTPIEAALTLDYAGGNEQKWHATDLRASSPSLDLTSIGKCLRLPYRITGSAGTDGRYHWKRLGGGGKEWEAVAAARLNEVELLPEGGQVPFRLTDIILDMTMDKGEHSTGTLTLAARQAELPAFGELWFLPLRTDPDLLAKFPSMPRDWTYQLAAQALTLPPWKGTEFVGAAYTTETTGGLTHYRATVDGGDIDGTYHNNKVSNAYESSVQFRNVPIAYFLDHLDYPPVLTGLATGDVVYGLDRDDRGTLQGTGTFDVRGGRVDTALFASQLEGNLQDGNMGGFPAALPFDRLHAELAFHKDAVSTPTVQLASEGLSIDASGMFIHGGDMNYDLKLAISPEAARKIPILTESFNIEGHRLSQQDIVLAFKVTGPTFNPKGELAGLPPASVTFVSGALGITSEAVKVIDTPRRILLDLLKMGGGILGAQNR